MRRSKRRKVQVEDESPLEDTDSLEVKFIDTYIGSGVFATREIPKGAYICNYNGETITAEEGEARLACKDGPCYLYFFNCKGNHLCIDGTLSTCIGRFLNDDHRRPNLKVVQKGEELCFYTIRVIKPGEELRFDYHDKNSFWRKKSQKREHVYDPPNDRAHGEGLAEPDRESLAEADREVLAEPDGEVLAEPDGEVLAEPDGGSLAGPDGEGLAGPDGESLAEADGESLAEADGESLAGPDGESLAEADGESLAGPDGESLAEADGEGLAGPDGESLAGPDGASLAEPDGESLAGPDGESLAGPDGESLAEADGESLAGPDGESLAEADGEGLAGPDGESLAEADGEGLAGPDGESLAGPDGASLAEPDGESLAGPDGESLAGPDGESLAEADGESLAGPDGEGLAGPDGESLAEADGESLAGPDGESLAGPDGESLAGPDGESLAEADGESLAGPDGESLAGPDGESLAGPDGESLAEADGESLAEADGESLAGPDGESLAGPDGESLAGPDGESLAGPDGESLAGPDGESLAEADGEGLAGPDGESLAEADGESLAEADGEGLAGPDGESLAEADGEGLAGPDGESLAGPDGESLAEADGESLAEADGESLAGPDGESLAGPDGEGLAGPDGESLAEADGESLAGPDGESLAGPDGESLAEADGEGLAGPDGESLAEADGESLAGPDGESLAGPDGESLAEADGEGLAGPDGESLAEADGEGLAGPDGESLAGPDGESLAEADGESLAGPDGESLAEADGESLAGPDGEGLAGPDGESLAEADGESLAGPDGESLAGPDGEGLAEADGESLAGPDGESLAGPDGESLAEADGEGLAGPDGESLAGPDGESLAEADGEGLAEADGEGLAGPDGESLAGPDGESLAGPDGESLAEADGESLAEADGESLADGDNASSPYGSIVVCSCEDSPCGIFEMKNTACLIGSADWCDIVCKTGREEHFRIEVNRTGQAFLVDIHTKKAKFLKHADKFTAGGRVFQWMYKGDEQVVTGDRAGEEALADGEEFEDEEFEDEDYGDDDGDDDFRDPDFTLKDDRESSSSEDDTDTETTDGKCTNEDDYLQHCQQAESGDTHSSEEMSEIIPPSVEEIDGTDYPRLVVDEVKRNTKGNLSNKKHYCPFCEELRQNIARHYELKHKNELEVARILVFPKKSKERRKLWDAFVKKGDFAYNFEVLKTGKGTIIPKSRARNCDTTVKNVLPCQYCHGMYRRNELWRHQKSCQLKKSPSGYETGPIAGAKKLLPTTSFDKDFNNNIILRMKEDDIKRAVISDSTILEYGLNMYNEHGHQKHKHVYISQKMRELGRLRIAGEKNKLNSIEDCMKKENWETFITSVKDVSGFDKDTNSFGIPSLALKLGQAVKNCAEDLKFTALQSGSKEKREIAETFLDMYSLKWKKCVSGKALNTLETNKYNRPKLLPLVEDVARMNNYINEKLESNTDVYRDFCQLCLVQIMVFNRKRSGEAERMTISQFNKAKVGGVVDPVILSTLTKFEQTLCKSYLRVEIVGKKGNKVPVLLTNKMQRNLHRLIELRSQQIITNDCMFARPGDSRFPYRGVDCLRKVADEADLKSPELITSTSLRKQLATMAQVLNLNETSQDLLAAFEGHDIRVHRQFYRLPQESMQVAKVSKLLHCLNNGTIGKYSGCDYDDIEFELDVEAEAENVEDEDEEVDNGDEDDTDEGAGDRVPMDALKGKKRKLKNQEQPKAKRTKVSEKHVWSSEEKGALEEQFSKNIRLGKVPGKIECINAQRKSGVLCVLPWKKIKFAVYNIIKNRLKCM